MKHTTKSDQETFDLGRKFAGRLKGGEVIGLIGPLGAGKTVFTQGLAAGLGVKKTINSPTFVIMKVYEVKGKKLVDRKKDMDSHPISNIEDRISKLVHIDAYRLNSYADIEAIGAPDYFGRSDAVTVIEWADRIKELVPDKIITFQILESKRKITIK